LRPQSCREENQQCVSVGRIRRARGSSDPFFGGKAVFHAQIDWIASATGRFGYTWNQWLFYARGGGAWAGDKYTVSGIFAGDPFALAGNETRFGWTIGGGIEWAFWQRWSANLEYAYYDFGNRSISFGGPIDFGSGAESGSIKQTVQTVTLGISYHF
jgi:opacity protein-like surface antigen